MIPLPWLTVVGVGEAPPPPALRALVATAEVTIGAPRHLAHFPEAPSPTGWPSPFAAAREMLTALRGQRVVVLASGDPQWFGVGVTVRRWFPPEEVATVPHVGSFSLAAARLGWPLAETLCLSVHARPLASLSLHLAPGRRLLVLTGDGTTPATVARLLCESGWGASLLEVGENLGGLREHWTTAVAGAWAGDVGDLNVLAITCRPDPGTRVLSVSPGLEDEAFLHDGQLTKREVRAVTLAALVPVPGQRLWDIGAGCGSIAVEWMRAGGLAVAIEETPERCALIARNAVTLGVPQVEILSGRFPDVVPSSSPDAVFVGGGVSSPGVLERAWAALSPGGRLVVNAVTVEGEAKALEFHQHHGGEIVRLEISRLTPLGAFQVWRPALPVTQYRGVKD